jgi:hypothetical protein
MSLRLTWLNCLWLMLPLMAWNILLGPRIQDARITSDAHLPAWLLLAENISRILTFALPLLLPLLWRTPWNKGGLVLYGIGTLLYFASWLPYLFAPNSAWSNSAAGLLAPRLTPLLPFLGLALIGESWLYSFVCALFVLFHTWHGIQNLAH